MSQSSVPGGASESFGERMRRRWNRRRAESPQGGGRGGPGVPGTPWGHVPYEHATPAPGAPGEAGPGQAGPGAAGPAPAPTAADRARMMHQQLTEAYQRGDVAQVTRITELMPEGPQAEPYRTYARVLEAEARADDPAASAIARGYLDTIAPGHPEWDTARRLYGEVTVQGLVLGRILLAGNLDEARRALTDGGQAYLHPSGLTLRLQPDDEYPLLLVLDGETGKAVRLARRQVRQEQRQGREHGGAGLADALCTLALCLRADGDAAGAARALDEAERVLPGRPRIAVTRARVEGA